MLTAHSRLKNLLGLLLIGRCLVVQAQSYLGAELRSLDYFQYGRFEARIKSAQGEGYLSSFFTYNDSFPHTPWAEIDFEILGRWANNVDMNVIEEQGSHLRQNPLNFNPHLDFHTYAFEWTPDYVAWFIDGEEAYRQTGTHINGLLEPGKIMMNVWTPAFADWVGTIDDRTLPRFSYYDWVSYASYTPGSGSIGTDANFTPEWLDNFDVFDLERWEKSDGHSWNGNNATLVADNIVFKDGHMIMCLTLPDKPGLQDDNPPHALWARAHQPDSLVVRFSEELDLESATSVSTYNIPGSNIQRVYLHPDQRTVSILLAEPSLTENSTVYALGLKDRADPSNTQVGTYTKIIHPKPLDLPINIDVAGPGASGFLPDQWWSAEVEYGHEGGNYQVAGDYPDLSGTDLDSVMATSLNRYSRYHVRLEPGVFDVQLHFAEHHYSNAGERVFQLFVEDSLIIAELDVFEAVGNSAALTVSIPDLQVTDGTLDILGAALVYGRSYGYAGPLLNGIQIDGTVWTSTDDVLLPTEHALTAIYPNPFNDSTTIVFNLEDAAKVNISLYDLRGVELQTLTNRAYSAGSHHLRLEAHDLPSGLYVLRFKAGLTSQKTKILLLK
ncbi:MAG: family 16 glycosylhydrolase [Candidatus Marinimicrobia bacterium]|nr:family 16 glycosylhydrolase [Candidatus Neomarinimicrobiota bacterium]MCF7850403.1 family 16 glycosylhydrolase [Candidatus Neomarinimicrobiota bacterium]MCF7904548.1 family 16 glycosylhydrolase [Candidatus Neomarinimicrobiota bacterium]